MYVAATSIPEGWPSGENVVEKNKRDRYGKKTSQWKAERHKQQDIPDSMLGGENKPLDKRKRTTENSLGFTWGKCFPGKCHRVN